MTVCGNPKTGRLLEATTRATELQRHNERNRAATRHTNQTCVLARELAHWNGVYRASKRVVALHGKRFNSDCFFLSLKRDKNGL